MIFEQEVILLIAGGVVGLISAIVGALFQHRLEIKRYERQLADRQQDYERQLIDQQRAYERQLEVENERLRELELEKQLLMPGDVKEIRERLAELRGIWRALEEKGLIDSELAERLFLSLGNDSQSARGSSRE